MHLYLEEFILATLFDVVQVLLMLILKLFNLLSIISFYLGQGGPAKTKELALSCAIFKTGSFGLKITFVVTWFPQKV